MHPGKTSALVAALLIAPAIAAAQETAPARPAPREPAPAQPAYFEFQVTKTVRPLSGRPPEYPRDMLAARAEGRVLVQFVVDTTGAPEMRTFKVLEASNVGFVEAVRTAVAAMRFTPAMIADRRVRQVVQQPFNFSVQ